MKKQKAKFEFEVPAGDNALYHIIYRMLGKKYGDIIEIEHIYLETLEPVKITIKMEEV